MKFHPVLQKILDEKKREVEFIRNYEGFTSPKKLPFVKSLKSQKISIIAECKKASPSAGVIRENYLPVEIAKSYEKSGATAISVLTDQNFFRGSAEDLQNISSSTKLPILRKDFIIDKKQILQAKFLGASAVLLIVRILDFPHLRELYEYSKSLDLDVLVETHTLDEAKQALTLGAEIIGINTRDLDTFQIHPHIISEISKILPFTVHRVGESGINSSSDLREMLKYVDSALIGTYFMKSADIEKSYHELVAPLMA